MRRKQFNKNCTFFIFCVLSFIGRSLSDDLINNITCKAKASSLPNVNHQKNIKVRCPANCQLSKCRVTGTSVYTSFSGVCCAGIHAGILSANIGGILNVEIDHYGGRNYVGSTSNGVTSQEYSLSWHLDFTVSGESEPLSEPRVAFGISTTTSKPSIELS
uniref:LCCL domain-containing protein n=1 Tax=Ciona savignyi TaxID=51511 RepID=H2Z609_CIOSA